MMPSNWVLFLFIFSSVVLSFMMITHFFFLNKNFGLSGRGLKVLSNKKFLL